MPLQPPEPPNRKRTPPHDRRYPELARDRGMARTTIATRWIAAGGVAGVAVFAGLAAVSTQHASGQPTPAVTDVPASDGTSVSSTTPATTAAPSVATTPPATASKPTTAVTNPPTTPATVAPAQQAPAQVPRNHKRSPVVTSGSS
jgi:hypothetical protein